jgi:hypothetical protein
VVKSDVEPKIAGRKRVLCEVNRKHEPFFSLPTPKWALHEQWVYYGGGLRKILMHAGGVWMG